MSEKPPCQGTYCFYCGTPLSTSLPPFGPAICPDCVLEKYGDLFSLMEDFED